MKLSFGDDELEVAADAVQVRKSDGSLTDQESVNQLLVAEIQALRDRVKWLEGEHGLPDLPDGYELADCHIFECINGWDAVFPTNDVKYVWVNGEPVVTSKRVDTVEVPASRQMGDENAGEMVTKQVTRTVVSGLEDGDIMHAIFDWNNWSMYSWLDWFKDIRQIGLNSETGKRNQVNTGNYAFYGMQMANPDVIANLDVSNITGTECMFLFNDILNQDFSNWDTSNFTWMEGMFKFCEEFEGIGLDTWDTSKVRDMGQMFQGCHVFNADISGWNTITVTDSWMGMMQMFDNAKAFNQDLSEWCVQGVDSEPSNFDRNADAWTLPNSRPVWGTCPRGEYLPDGYGVDDVWKFKAYRYGCYVPTPVTETIIYAAVNGKEVTPRLNNNRWFIDNVNNDDIVELIFDWDNSGLGSMDWIQEVQKTGSRSVGGEPFLYQNPAPLPSGRIPNQVKNGKGLLYMCEDPKRTPAFQYLDTSNLTSLERAFEDGYNANLDVNDWDVSNVKDFSNLLNYAMMWNRSLSKWNVSKAEPGGLDRMFIWASNYGYSSAGSLANWCVSNFPVEPNSFSLGSGLEYETHRQPVWGTCPNGENSQDPTPPAGYTMDDVHTFVLGFQGKVNLPILPGTQPIWVALGPDTADYETDIKGNQYPGETLHAIFDWDMSQASTEGLNWIEEIVQFGSRSVGGEAPGYVNPTPLASGRIANQLKSGKNAFWRLAYHTVLEGAGDVLDTLDTSNLHDMQGMFFEARYVNEPLDSWDTSNVTNMGSMFRDAQRFNQDLTGWCVQWIGSLPLYFGDNSALPSYNYPVWGTCPTPPGGGNGDMHIFVANNNPVNFPIPNGTPVAFCSVDGVEMDYNTEVKGKVFNGLTIEAIFDWDNKNFLDQNWYSDILQFGLNSLTGKRNQIASGMDAFVQTSFTTCKAIENLDVSNVTNCFYMFEGSNFKGDLSKWDTSNVTDMDNMFKDSAFDGDITTWDTSNCSSMVSMFSAARSFNQDLSGWCVTKIGAKPAGFDSNTDAWPTNYLTRPQWGRCP